MLLDERTRVERECELKCQTLAAQCSQRAQQREREVAELRENFLKDSQQSTRLHEQERALLRAREREWQRERDLILEAADHDREDLLRQQKLSLATEERLDAAERRGKEREEVVVLLREALRSSAASLNIAQAELEAKEVLADDLSAALKQVAQHHRDKLALDAKIDSLHAELAHKNSRIREMEDALADERQTTGVQALQIQDLYRKLAEREVLASELQCQQDQRDRQGAHTTRAGPPVPTHFVLAGPRSPPHPLAVQCASLLAAAASDAGSDWGETVKT